jgi:hypothetical protein
MSLLRVSIVIHGPEDTEAIDRDIAQALTVGFRGTEFELEQLEEVYEFERYFEVTLSQTYKMTANGQAEAVDEARSSLFAQIQNEGHKFVRHADVQVEGGEYTDAVVRGFDESGSPIWGTVDV